MGTTRWINDHVKDFPIPVVPKTDQSTLSKRVNHILTAKKKNPEADTSALEKEIDVIVYKLYGLTYDEVKIIDPGFGMSTEEYGRVS